MRARTVLAIVLLLAPVVDLGAQRLPRIRGRGVPRAAELPPGPPSVQRELAYKRSRMAFESYPFVSHSIASGFIAQGVVTSWTSFGMGTRAEYRVNPRAALTLDVTQSLVGGPALTETAEIGTRLRPRGNDRRFYPFIDFRLGYMHAYDTYFRPVEGDFGFPQPFGPGSRYTQGVGAVGGVGGEYGLNSSWSLVTSVSAMRNRMSTYSFDGAPMSTNSYRMTSYRYLLGVRYNRTRMVIPPTQP
jgi:hypothetical protein